MLCCTGAVVFSQPLKLRAAVPVGKLPVTLMYCVVPFMFCPNPMAPVTSVAFVMATPVPVFADPVASPYPPAVLFPSSPKCQTPENPAAVGNAAEEDDKEVAAALPQYILM